MYTKRFIIIYSRIMRNNLNINCALSTRKISFLNRSLFSKVGNPTAGVVVIGDEILKGQVVDNNIPFIANRLYGLGVKLVKVSIVGDKIEEISEEIKKFSRNYTYVITTGGIGPTHDDVTYEAVGHAFGEPLAPHPVLMKICEDFFKTSDLSSPALKLALIPKSGVLNFGYDKEKGVRTMYPTVSVHNVFIFPGVSQLMKKSFDLLSEDLFGKSNVKFYMKEMFLAARETDIADHLNKVVEEYPLVTFGSYPNLFNSYYGVKLTVESLDSDLLEEAYERLKYLIPSGLIINYDSDPIHEAYLKIQNLISGNIPSREKFGSTLKESVREAIHVLEECARKYSPTEVAICFSGGKDSTALLHMWYAVLMRNSSSISSRASLQGISVADDNGFHEINEFVLETTERYKMDLTVVKGSLKSGIKEYLSMRPGIKALLFGSRINDPGCETLNTFTEADIECINVMKICPLRRWSYADVWNFMLSLNLPYCTLYDRGYTSLGNTDDTLPNPKLASKETVYTMGARRGSTHYPAYELTDFKAERLGRKTTSIYP